MSKKKILNIPLNAFLIGLLIGVSVSIIALNKFNLLIPTSNVEIGSIYFNFCYFFIFVIILLILLNFVFYYINEKYYFFQRIHEKNSIKWLIYLVIFLFIISILYALWFELTRDHAEIDPDYVCFLVGSFGSVMAIVTMAIYFMENMTKIQENQRTILKMEDRIKEHILMKEYLDVSAISNLLRTMMENKSNEIKEIQLRGIQGLQIIDHTAEELTDLLVKGIPIKIILLAKDQSALNERSKFEAFSSLDEAKLNENQAFLMEQLTFNKFISFHDASITFLKEIFFRAYLKQIQTGITDPEIPLYLHFINDEILCYTMSIICTTNVHDNVTGTSTNIDKTKTFVNFLPKIEEKKTRRGTKNLQYLYSADEPQFIFNVNLFRAEFQKSWNDLSGPYYTFMLKEDKLPNTIEIKSITPVD